MVEIIYKDEYEQALNANKKLIKENKQLRMLIDKLKMDLSEYGDI